jgi:hypothetical protein
MADSSQLPPGSFDDRSPVVIGSVVFCLVVATVAVSLRIYTRKFVINQLGIDDYFSVFALVSHATLLRYHYDC